MPSIISEGLHITGNIASDGDVQVDGSVSGDVHVRQLTIGVSGRIEGKIVAEEIVVSGTVDGEMSAKSVMISRTAHVVGDVLHDVLSIESGAEFQGRCQRRPANELETPKSAAQMAMEQKAVPLQPQQQPVKAAPVQPQAAVKPVAPPKAASAPVTPVTTAN